MSRALRFADSSLIATMRCGVFPVIQQGLPYHSHVHASLLPLGRVAPGVQ
jgi:hypothetical protein